MPEPMLETLLLLAAAGTAGALNAVAGGGSFLTLPALVFSGVPPVMANATGTVALFPGYIASAWGFREDLAPPPGLTLRALVSVINAISRRGPLLLVCHPVCHLVFAALGCRWGVLATGCS